MESSQSFNSIYVRLSSIILVVTFIAALLAVGSFSLIQYIKQKEYGETRMAPAMRMAAQLLVEKQQQGAPLALTVLLEDFNRYINYDFHLHPLARLDLSRVRAARLAKQQVLLDILGQNHYRAYVALPSDTGQILTLEFNNLLATSSALLVRLMVEQLKSLPAAHWAERLQHWQQNDQLALQSLPLNGLSLSPFEQYQLGEGRVVMPLAESQTGSYALLRIAGSPHVLQLGPIQGFQRFPPLTIGLVILNTFLLTAIVVYLMVGSLEKRLRVLERATGAIAQGQLEARVVAKGEDTIAILGRAFNAMAEHIQRLIQVQREMIRAISHELRTPVARIRFALQMLEDLEQEPEKHSHLKGMDADIQELDVLIDEILTYARLEEGGPLIEFQSTDVEEVARHVVEERRPGNILVQLLPCQLPVAERTSEVEARYIHRALQNLVNNAQRYAKSQVQVSFSMQVDVCRIDVDDDGPGIPESEWERVFAPFSRLDDSRTRASGGYGLGLSIVRRIMFWHAGRAFIDKSPLGGARFSLVWPRLQNQNEPTTAPQA